MLLAATLFVFFNSGEFVLAERIPLFAKNAIFGLVGVGLLWIATFGIKKLDDKHTHRHNRTRIRPRELEPPFKWHD